MKIFERCASSFTALATRLHPAPGYPEILSRRLACTAALALVLATSVLPAVAGTQVVHPTGIYPLDVQNVQAAVDAGGTVLLKAGNGAGAPIDFNFGPNTGRSGGLVWITTDVEIIGERVGTRMATIRGGYVPFGGGAPTHTRIKGLNFEAPQLSAIILLRSAGTEITDNRITQAPGVVLPWGDTEGRGIKLLGNSDPEHAITGSVRIANNVIEDMPANLSNAITLDSVAADTEIHGNRIRNSSGILVISASGKNRVYDNVIEPGAGDGQVWGDGIDIAGSLGGSFHVFGNVIRCAHPWSDGIWILGGSWLGAVENPVIERNRITMLGTLGAAIAFDGAINRATVQRNQADGNASFAIRANDPFGENASGNVFMGNEISRLRSGIADVILDAHTRGSALAGYSGTVIDLGLANRITGFSMTPGSNFGGQIREALATKRKAAILAMDGYSDLP